MKIDLESFIFFQQKVNKEMLEEIKELTKMVSFLNKKMIQPKKQKGEYSFVVQDWGVDGPKFRSEQDEWPPVGTRFVSVKE